MIRKSALIITLAALLGACSGSDGISVPPGNGGNGGNGGGGDPPPSSNDTQTGVFVDSAVSGIGYRTDTQEGETSAAGEFEYVDGESIVFFIGDVELPAVAASGVLTPRDLFTADDFTDRRVTNLARLLQSLDANGDPENGIELTPAAHAAATGLSLDFDVPTDEFEANADVINLVSNGGGPGTLVSAAAALQHVQRLSIAGGWHLIDGEDYITLVFMQDGTYLIAEGTEFSEGDPNGFPGVEYGTYTWNPVTGLFSVDVEFDSNGDWGLSHHSPDETIGRVDGAIEITDPADADDSMSFESAANSENPLAGAWLHELPSADGGGGVVILFNDTHYSWADVRPGKPTEEGAEFGSYIWNPGTGALFPVPLVDHNGVLGFSGEGAEIDAVVDGDTLTLTLQGGSEAVFTRIE